MRRTARHVKIHRQERAGAVARLGQVDEGSPRDRAGADGDDEAGIGDRLVRLAERQRHVARDGARHQQPVGVARRGDKLDAEAAQVPAHRGQHVAVGFAGVASAGADLAQLEGSPEEPPEARVQRGRRHRPGSGRRPARHDERLARAGRQLVAGGEGDGLARTGRRAGPAEETAPQIDPVRVFAPEGAGRTGRLAGAAAAGTRRSVDDRPAAEPVGQRRRRRIRITDRPVPLLEARERRFDHGRILTDRVRSRTG